MQVAQTWSRGLGSRPAVLLFVLAVRAGVAPRQAGRLVVAVVIWDHEDNINIKYDVVAEDLGAEKKEFIESYNLIVEKLYLGMVEEVECEAWDCLVSEQFLNSYDLRF